MSTGSLFTLTLYPSLSFLELFQHIQRLKVGTNFVPGGNLKDQVTRSFRKKRNGSIYKCVRSFT